MRLLTKTINCFQTSCIQCFYIVGLECDSSSKFIIGSRVSTKLITMFFIFYHWLLIFFFSKKPITIFRYVAGPNSYTFCQFEYLLKNVMSMKVPMYISFVSVLRYIFISHSKNPTAIQDDFWALFLEIWTIGMICTKGLKLT